MKMEEMTNMRKFIDENRENESHQSINTVIFAIAVMLLFSLMMLLKPSTAKADSRIKDIVNFEGVRPNMLIGYGLVVGLNGTGDKLNNTAFTEQSLTSFLERQGINSKGTTLKTKNVAAVTVTGFLPPFARNGGRLNVSVSTIGDAKSIQGGTLLATPLMGADGQVYAVAQGSIVTESVIAGSGGTSISKGIPTSGSIPNGGIVEREIAYEMNSLNNVKLALMNPDISTAQGIAKAINSKLGSNDAKVNDPGTVTVNVPEKYKNSVVGLLHEIELIPIKTDQPAKIVIDEASGTIVMGENVKVDTVAVAQGNLVVRIRETPIIIQPGAFAPDSAETVVATATDVSVEEGGLQKMAVLNKNANLNELVDGLNSLGVGPRDMISLLQTIKAAGAIQANIETR